ncbi:HAMP domain-containing protein [Deinococcus metalli]|uniref:histidine kinase n=1 Tax=Deinococcus metalli TaxID=1141878 RepID=A0A7W8KB19_9DEIO|nr:HAMP domain-containing protein [Deinococcus metalli]MBB5374640.1 HAMP domain-containing protein [Deinococcus metalli]GHF34807.1 HAMP domain-containing protein [Deinococcus metalli]
MKYTVVINRAVSEAEREGLEVQLTQRFGLNAEQASRLASRRTGRLMKPTSRARAELLLGLFEGVGAGVALESVRDETTVISEPFAASAPLRTAAPQPDDALLAPARAARPDPFGAALPEWPSAPLAALDPHAAAVLPTDPSDAPGDLDFVSFADTHPSARRAGPVGSGAGLAATAEVLTVDPGTFGRLTAPAPAALGSVAAPEVDVWSDFTGALTMHEPASTPDAKPEEVVPVMLPVTPDEGSAARGVRVPLSRRLLLATLLPLGLAAAVTLLLLSALLPRLQSQVVRDQARTLAATLGTTLTTGSESLAYMQLDTVLKDPNVAFVRIEKAGGVTYLRSKDAKVNDSWNKSVGAWTAAHPDGGTMKLGGASYVVTRLSVVGNAIGQPTAVPVSAEKGDLMHRVTVGLRNDVFSANLRNTVLLIVLTLLFSLAIASILANRAARAIVQPIEQLVRSADAISMGDLSRSVSLERNDEIGDLAQALERMRLSLESALERLRRRKRE